MEKENLRHQIAKYVAEKLDRVLDRFLTPEPTTEAPKNLSKKARFIWSYTADWATEIVKPRQTFLESCGLTTEEIALLGTRVHELVYALKKEETDPQNVVFTELDKKHFSPSEQLGPFGTDSTPTTRLLIKFAQRKRKTLYSLQEYADLFSWQASIEQLADTLLEKQVPDLEIEKNCKAIVENRPDFARLQSKTPSGPQVPGAE